MKKKELSNQLKELRKEEILKLVNKINIILENYMNTNSIDFILSKQGVYLSKTTYDITQEILEIVNKSKMTNHLDKKQIKELLPHREPMLLIDELYDIKKLNSATGVVNVKKVVFLYKVIPDQPVMPGVVIVESFDQVLRFDCPWS